MIKDFILPDIGEGIVECEVVDWLVAEGEWVEEDQAICDVMTDKALVQIPAKEAGIITRLYYQKGALARVDAPLFALEVVAEQSDNEERVNTSQVSKPTSETQHSALVEDEPATARLPPLNDMARPSKALASPAVRRFAREHQIDLAQINGSGKHGRVYKEDIQRHLQADEGQLTASAQPAQLASTQVSDERLNPQDKVMPICGMQAVMAKRMTESVQNIPHFSYCDEFDVTELVALRARLKGQYEQQGVNLTLMPFFIKALSLALSQHPILNSRINADCTELTYLANHNIGMAVDGKLGLIVPNIKQVESKNMLELADDIARLTQAARDGRVEPADLKQGTISLSNIGALGGTVASPIINKPEVAIVALGKIQLLPRFNGQGNVEARRIMPISWSADHRVIDGATMARFCNLWRQYLEQPTSMLMTMR